MTPNIARKVIQSFQKTPQNDVDLTAVEKLILKGLANGLSYKALAEEIHLSIDGVRYHIRNIYRKLEAKNSSEAVAKGIDYIDP